ncbi:MAG: hypothetical protein IIC75_09545 [Bacteroidetes bacterium]|nr:hypothetical protein [Bacteroidota bacterium]
MINLVKNTLLTTPKSTNDETQSPWQDKFQLFKFGTSFIEDKPYAVEGSDIPYNKYFDPYHISMLEDELLKMKFTLNSLTTKLKELTNISNSQRKEIFAIKKAHNLDKVSRFAEYKNNWDGYGAPKISNKIIEKSIKLIFENKITIQPNFFPTGRGTLQFELEPDDNHYLEIELFSDKIHGLIIINDEETKLNNLNWEHTIKTINDFQSKYCN